MNTINEAYSEEVSAKDGGVIFQACISHNVSWNIINGQTEFNQDDINTTLHEVEVFPDLNYKSGEATSVYYILSEVNILKRKFDLASLAIKKRISPKYAAELKANPEKHEELNQEYFSGTSFRIELTTDKIYLREQKLEEEEIELEEGVELEEESESNEESQSIDKDVESDGSDK